MGTSSLKIVLDRDLAKVGAKAAIDMICPLLRELVNHATHAFQRCQAASDIPLGIDEDIAPLSLYRMVTECTDGIEELVAECCSLGTVPLLRASFEGVLSLEYINQKDSARRALCWLHEYIMNRRRAYHLLTATSPQGQTFSQAWKSQFGRAFREPPDVDKAIANLDRWLARPHIAPIHAEYERVSPRKGRGPKWHALFGGPTTIEALAKLLNHQADYQFMYRYWSSVVHANDASTLITRLSNGRPGFFTMRYPRDLPQIGLWAAILQLSATRSMLGRFRPGEDISPWYRDEVQAGMTALRSTEFRLNIIEEGEYPG